MSRESGFFYVEKTNARAAHEERGRFDIPGRNDGAGCAEVEAECDVSGGQVVWQGDVWERTLPQMMIKRRSPSEKSIGYWQTELTPQAPPGRKYHHDEFCAGGDVRYTVVLIFTLKIFLSLL